MAVMTVVETVDEMELMMAGSLVEKLVYQMVAWRVVLTVDWKVVLWADNSVFVRVAWKAGNLAQMKVGY